MTGWFDRIRQLWRRLWRTPAPPPEAPVPAPVVVAPAPVPLPVSDRDQKIHALELARLRHDKFVKPKGERPKRERVPRPPRPAPPDEEPISVGDAVVENRVKSGNKLVADEWFEGDGKGDVLYLEQEFYGEFNFRDSILDQLDRYWVYLERMRKHDYAAYAFCAKLGATLVPYSTTFSNRIRGKKDFERDIVEYKEKIALPPWFKEHWPAFGCIAIGTNPLDEEQELKEPDKTGKSLWVVKFLYFYKFEKTPWYVQPTRGGHLYSMTIWWDRPHDQKFRRRKWGVPEQYFIWIADDGKTMRALKTRQTASSFRPAGDWRLDYELEEEERKRGYTPQVILARQFCDAARLVEQASYAMCRVEVSKGDLTATFGIDARRTAYFFRDRDIHLTDGGTTKPIFHLVRPHKRVDGSIVPMHFRGLKQFSWANYNVCITVPGRDHFMLPEWSVGVESPPRHGRWSKKEYMSEREIAELIRKKLKSGAGAHRP